MKTLRRFAHIASSYWLVLVVAASLATLAGCGGGGGGGNGGPPPAPVASLSPTSLTFTSQTVGTTSSAQPVTLTNTGNATLNITSITISGDFNATTTCPNPGSLSAGSNCTVTVTFAPTASGSRTGTISIVDDAAGSPQAVALTGTGSAAVNNQAQVTVDLGPPALIADCTAIGSNVSCDADTLFVTVTVCAPGSTTNCQTIDHVAVDTGSSGLRILQTVLTSNLASALPLENASSGSPLGNCVVFADNSFIWGPVVNADVSIAGETTAGSTSFTSGLPIQVISAPGSNFGNLLPAGCSGTFADNTVDVLGANGLIGVSVFQQDCGPYCVSNIPSPAAYYSCPSSGCTGTTEPLLGQLQNPVWAFLHDNNGLSINLPAIPQSPDIGEATVAGTLTFGIGTQSNNALGTATVYTTDDVGDFAATYNGVKYGTGGIANSGAYIDSGSNGLYFLDPTTTGMSDCGGNFTGFYCPASVTSFTVTNAGSNGNSGQVTIKFDNAVNLLNNNPSFAAFDDFGGQASLTVDYGLPFFFGRTVFVGIEGQSANGTFWAY